MVRSLLREPLVHFLVAGALLFGLYAALDRTADEPRGVIRITAVDLEWLSASWLRQHRRAPDDRELRQLVVDHLRQELLAREARALGLDEEDTIVRRRLAQKMEFLLQDAVLLGDPDEAELRRLHGRDGSLYRSAASVSFTQLFFAREPDAERGLGALEAGAIDGLGDPTLLAHQYARVDEPTVANLFGHAFAERLFDLEAGVWRGPLRSAYGFHLVRVTERQPAAPLPFDEAREQIRANWLRDRKTEADDLLFRSLLEKYELIVDDAVGPWLGPLARAGP